MKMEISSISNLIYIYKLIYIYLYPIIMACAITGQF
jgi:hypothetical protein